MTSDTGLNVGNGREVCAGGDITLGEVSSEDWATPAATVTKAGMEKVGVKLG